MCSAMQKRPVLCSKNRHCVLAVCKKPIWCNFFLCKEMCGVQACLAPFCNHKLDKIVGCKNVGVPSIKALVAGRSSAQDNAV